MFYLTFDSFLSVSRQINSFVSKTTITQEVKLQGTLYLLLKFVLLPHICLFYIPGIVF